MNAVAVLPIAICIMLETFQQLSYSMSRKAPDKSVIFLSLGIIFYFLFLLSWFWLLSILPLGVATPLLGTSYITVAIASKVLFKEEIDTLRWIGIIAIVSGLTLISIN